MSKGRRGRRSHYGHVNKDLNTVWVWGNHIKNGPGLIGVPMGDMLFNRGGPADLTKPLRQGISDLVAPSDRTASRHARQGMATAIRSALGAAAGSAPARILA